MEKNLMHEKAHEEAVKRMKKIGLFENIVEEFEADGTVNYSERVGQCGILYWLKNKPEWVKIVKEIEEEYDILVYHMTHEYTAFGECLSMLYVSSDETTWADDMYDLEQKEEDGSFYCYSYVYNLTDPVFSEFGDGAFKTGAGGLIRTE